MAGPWDATQTAALDAVIACAEQSGFASVTTRRVAEVAGVNEATIFRRFGSKAQLIAAAFEREAAGEVGEYTGDLHADLERIVAAVWGAAGRRRSTIPVIRAELASNEELRAATGHSMDIVGRVAGLLERYQTAGLLREEPPLLAYASLVGPLVFLGIVGQMMAELPPLDIPAHVIRCLEDRLRPSNERSRNNLPAS